MALDLQLILDEVMIMKLECSKCGYEKSRNTVIYKVIGVALIALGFFAWKSYFFAGTGSALLICIGIMGGGVLILFFSNEIEKIFAINSECPSCQKSSWNEME